VKSADGALLQLLLAASVMKDPQIEVPRIEVDPALAVDELATLDVQLWQDHWFRVWEWYDSRGNRDPLSAPPALKDSTHASVFESDPYFAWLELCDEKANILDNGPEDAAYESILAAVRRGLNQVVVVPAIGDYSAKFGSHCLSVSSITRADLNAYKQAFELF
jgi:hypothetical protein